MQVTSVAKALRESGYTFDIAHTSVLKRAVHTTWLLLKELDLVHLGVYKHWRLNDRSCGALTGRRVEDVTQEHGEELISSLRRSFELRPPPYTADHPYHPNKERKYKRWQDRQGVVRPVSPPLSESLSDVAERCKQVYRQEILPDLRAGKNVLVIAHGNSIRGIIQAIDGVSNGFLSSLDVPDCIPIVYRFEPPRDPLVDVGQLRPIRTSDCVPPPLNCELLAGDEHVEVAKQRTRLASLERSGLLACTEDDAVSAGCLPGLECNTGFEWGFEPIHHLEYFSHSEASDSAASDEGEDEEDDALLLDRVPARVSFPPAFSLPSPLMRPQGARKPRRQHVVIIRHGKTEHNKLGLFTGWEDVPLAAEGLHEATLAGQLLHRHGYSFDVVYTSWLSRAIETAWLVLAELDNLWTPIHKSWRLNERMYGALTGLSKKKTRAQYGDEQFKRWRRSYNTPPPPVDSFSPHYPGNDDRYVQNVIDLRPSFRESLVRSVALGRVCIHRKLPRSESLKDCMDRTIPYWLNTIEPSAIDQGKSVLIASSENAIRGLLMHLLDIPPQRIAEIEIPNGLPMVYDVQSKRLQLLEGSPSDYKFGKGGAELLFGCKPQGSGQR